MADDVGCVRFYTTNWENAMNELQKKCQKILAQLADDRESLIMGLENASFESKEEGDMANAGLIGLIKHLAELSAVVDP
jgi:hypothetical protein